MELQGKNLLLSGTGDEARVAEFAGGGGGGLGGLRGEGPVLRASASHEEDDSDGGGGESLTKEYRGGRRHHARHRGSLLPPTSLWHRYCFCCGGGSVRWLVLLVLCLQNSLFTVLRRYSQGVLLETYSKYECLLVGEVIKMVFSAYMIRKGLVERAGTGNDDDGGGGGGVNAPKNDTATTDTLRHRLLYITASCRKMVVLALIYGAMNILSFVSLRNIGAGLFTIFAQAKIFTTALFSSVILGRKYSWTKWRALISLVLGVLLFSEPVWGDSSKLHSNNPDARPLLGTAAVLIEVSLSGFASIYFEKIVKTDALQFTIWERNFQLALGSFPVYLGFIAVDGGGVAGFGGGWSLLAACVAALGAAGGLLVALSIKYGDSILKTLATTGAIVLSSFLDYWFLDGPLTATMLIAGGQVIVSICNYTFDQTSSASSAPGQQTATTTNQSKGAVASVSPRRSISYDNDEEAPLVSKAGDLKD